MTNVPLDGMALRSKSSSCSWGSHSCLLQSSKNNKCSRTLLTQCHHHCETDLSPAAILTMCPMRPLTFDSPFICVLFQNTRNTGRRFLWPPQAAALCLHNIGCSCMWHPSWQASRDGTIAWGRLLLEGCTEREILRIFLCCAAVCLYSRRQQSQEHARFALGIQKAEGVLGPAQH